MNLHDIGVWIVRHSSIIGIFFNFLMVLVWVTYLQLLLVQFHASRRSSILITRAAGRGMRSRCLVTNMSSQPLYVTSLIGTLTLGDRRIELPLTDLRDLPDDLGNDPRSRMGQGSLATGQYLDIGHFDDIVSTLLSANEDAEIEVSQVRQFTLTVVAFYAGDRLPVGAMRAFFFDRSLEKGPKVTPQTLVTDQVRERKRRKELLARVEYHM